MMFFPLILSLASATCGQQLDNSFHNRSILEGYAKYEIEPMYQVSVQYKWRHRCEGSIISAKYVLTAAHCIEDTLRGYLVRVRSSHPDFRRRVHAVVGRIIHPRFESNGLDFDIALLRVATPFVFFGSLQPVLLADQDERFAPGTLAVATDWGHLQNMGSYPVIPRKVKLFIITNEECRRSYPGKISSRMICAKLAANELGTCQDDSGGPLVANGKQVGIVSWGEKCGEDEDPVVFTKVTELRNWIRENSGV